MSSFDKIWTTALINIFLSIYMLKFKRFSQRTSNKTMQINWILKEIVLVYIHNGLPFYACLITSFSRTPEKLNVKNMNLPCSHYTPYQIIFLIRSTTPNYWQPPSYVDKRIKYKWWKPIKLFFYWLMK